MSTSKPLHITHSKQEHMKASGNFTAADSIRYSIQALFKVVSL